MPKGFGCISNNIEINLCEDSTGKKFCSPFGVAAAFSMDCLMVRFHKKIWGYTYIWLKTTNSHTNLSHLAFLSSTICFRPCMVVTRAYSFKWFKTFFIKSTTILSEIWWPTKHTGGLNVLQKNFKCNLNKCRLNPVTIHHSYVNRIHPSDHNKP